MGVMVRRSVRPRASGVVPMNGHRGKRGMARLAIRRNEMTCGTMKNERVRTSIWRNGARRSACVAFAAEEEGESVTTAVEEVDAAAAAAAAEQDEDGATKEEEEEEGDDKKSVATPPKVRWEDVVVGAKFTGSVVSVQSFGAFVKFGAPTDGLVHISKLTRGFVKEVGDVVSVGQQVEVYVLSMDRDQNRIALSMLDESEAAQGQSQGQGRRRGGSNVSAAAREKAKASIKVGDSFTGKVRAVMPFGAFVELVPGVDGLLHQKALKVEPGEDWREKYAVGTVIEDVVVNDVRDGRISVTNRDEDDRMDGDVMTATDNDDDMRRFENGEQRKRRPAKRRMKESADAEIGDPSFDDVPKGFERNMSALELAFAEAGMRRSNVGLGDLGAVQESAEEEAAALDAAVAEAEAAVAEAEAAVAEAEEAAETAAEVATVEEEVDEQKEDEKEKEEEALAPAPVAEEAAPAPAAAAVAAPVEEETKEETSAEPDFKVPAKMVKELREMTGSGMMDCKKALVESKGDVDAAVAWLRKKGIAKAEKKASRTAAEGAIHAYIHAGARLGVLLEVNCETDFAAKNDEFKELVDDIALQIAACPQVDYVNPSDAGADFVEREREIAMGMDDIKSKPENIREKIVEGRVSKVVNERALMQQAFVKDSNVTIEQVLKQAIAKIGENIVVRRFVRFNLGEGVEVAEKDFAAEVEEQAKAFEAAAAAKKEEEEAAAHAD